MEMAFLILVMPYAHKLTLLSRWMVTTQVEIYQIHARQCQHRSTLGCVDGDDHGWASMINFHKIQWSDKTTMDLDPRFEGDEAHLM